MTARASMTRRFRARARDVCDAVDAALDDVGATGVRWSRDGYRARAGMGFSLLSYGEALTVEVFADGEVEVVSQCVWPLQLVDWGKNKRNCRRLLDAVGDRLADP